MKKKLSYLVFFVLFILLWYFAARKINSSLILPDLQIVSEKFFRLLKDPFFWRNVYATFFRVVLSFLFSAASGILLGCFSGFSSFVKSFLSIPVSFIKSTPVVAIILISIFWFKSDFVPVFSAVLVVFPIVFESVSTGLENALKNSKILQMAEVYGFSKVQKVKYIFIPEIVPFLKNGFLSSFCLCWKVVASGEILCIPKNGLGTILQKSQVHLETTEVMATTFFIALASFLMEKLLFVAFSKNFFHRKYCVFRNQKITEIKENYGNFSASTHKLADYSENKGDIRIENLNLKFNGKTLYENFSLFIPSGEKLALISPSGNGKTSLLNEIQKKCGNVSYVFQEPRLLESVSILENVSLPLKSVFSESDATNRAKFFLKAAGLENRIYETPENLSGGERQRISICRAFAYPSEILLLDEPFNALDVQTKLFLIGFISDVLKKESRTVIFVTHDLYDAKKFADRIIVMKNIPNEIVLDMKSSEITVSELEDFIVEKMTFTV